MCFQGNQGVYSKGQHIFHAHLIYNLHVSRHANFQKMGTGVHNYNTDLHSAEGKAWKRKDTAKNKANAT